MLKKIEALGNGLLGLFVPRVEAAAGSAACQSWSACWQCNKAYGGACGYNAPCSTCNNGASYSCFC
ncbi:MULTISPECIES: hypothetical protein [unclassified Streptomyces]|uniref:hypothetical protein n=1 Tax=unclassified Streptomyces TaxID=2593676 RepID=UPI0029665041|nr:hypothetical protein [Streptomyces sp. SCL15-4]